MAINEKDPLVFRVPDGDVVVPTWGYIVEQLRYLIEPIITSEAAINSSLQRIDDKLNEWIDND